MERKRQKQREAQQRQYERQRARQRERQADPAYRQQQHDKAVRSAEKRQAKQLERLQSPEYRAQLVEKARQKQDTAASKPTAPKKTTPIRSRGTKGRTPTARERQIMDKLGALPCIACSQHGHYTYEISLHHIDGRVKDGAHELVLPLCNWHHQHAAPADLRAQYPWLIPVHAAGAVGGRKAFETANGGQLELLAQAYQMAGVETLKQS